MSFGSGNGGRKMFCKGYFIDSGPSGEVSVFDCPSPCGDGRAATASMKKLCQLGLGFVPVDYSVDTW